MYYLESAQFYRPFDPSGFFLANETAYFGLANGLSENLQLSPDSVRDQLDASIRQIANGSRNLKPARQRLGGVAKAYALHSARIINQYSPTVHSDFLLRRVFRATDSTRVE